MTRTRLAGAWAASESGGEFFPAGLTVEPSFFEWHIRLDPPETAARISRLAVDGRDYQRADSKYAAWYDGKYYVEADAGKIYTKELADGAVLTLELEDGAAGTFKYERASAALAPEARPDEPDPAVPEPGGPVPPAPPEAESDPPSSTPSLSLTVRSGFGSWYLAVEPADAAGSVRGLLVNDKAYEAVSSKWLTFNCRYSGRRDSSERASDRRPADVEGRSGYHDRDI